MDRRHGGVVIVDCLDSDGLDGGMVGGEYLVGWPYCTALLIPPTARPVIFLVKLPFYLEIPLVLPAGSIQTFLLGLLASQQVHRQLIPFGWTFAPTATTALLPGRITPSSFCLPSKGRAVDS